MHAHSHFNVSQAACLPGRSTPYLLTSPYLAWDRSSIDYFDFPSVTQSYDGLAPKHATSTLPSENKSAEVLKS